MAWLCGSPSTNLWQAGLMPERLADRPRLIHCHKRHIVYRTQRHCNTNTNTPRVADTLGKPLVYGSRVALKENIAVRSLLQLLIETCVLYCPQFFLKNSPETLLRLHEAQLGWYCLASAKHLSYVVVIGIVYFHRELIYLHASRFMK